MFEYFREMKTEMQKFNARKLIVIMLLATLLFSFNNTLKAQQKKPAIITFESLLQELTNREHLTYFTGNTYTLHQASSYDRRSVAKDKEGWYANNDWDGYVRKETVNGTDEYVLMDADGPGVITRFWAAGHPNQKAHLRFYMDGATTPFWEADHTGALIGQNVNIGAPLSQRSVEEDTLHINEGAQPGHNLYAPIPFNHHIKITCDRAPSGGSDHGLWYNINYRIYQPGTAIESFLTNTPKTYAKQLTLTNKKLDEFMKEPVAAAADDKVKIKEMAFNLAPGISNKLEVKGVGAIKKLTLTIKATDLDAAIKNLWVQITFDGAETVSVPAGFLFGCGTQMLVAKDWYTKAESDGNMAVYWVMPYQKNAVVKLVNEGSEAISGSLKLSVGDYKWQPNSMYFHVAYKELLNFASTAAQGKDFNYLTLKNKAGLYVGDVLQIAKNVGGWWGEGDEKIYVDGSTFPDNFGTGTEDYYGYAWGHPETFNHPFISQPIGDANRNNDTGGTTVNSRKRSLDAIPFTKSFVFDMEAWNWVTTNVDMRLCCFYYEKP